MKWVAVFPVCNVPRVVKRLSPVFALSRTQNHKWTESGGSVNKGVSAFKLVDSIKLSEIPDSSFY